MSRFKTGHFFYMKDIANRQNLEMLMETFYKRLLADATISFIFTDVAKIHLQSHLPHIVDFWEQNLLGTGNYKNNVLQIHKNLNDKEKLTSIHFKTWLMHIYNTADEHFEGPNTEKMKTRALSIATVMQIKLQ